MKAFFALFLCFYGSTLSAVHPVVRVEDSDSLEKFNMDFQQQSLDSNIGVYFEEMAKLQVYHSEWAFITSVNLSYFAEEMEHLENTVKNIQELCDSIKNEFSLSTSHCDHTLPQLYNLLDETKEYDIKWLLKHESLIQHHNNRLYRTRRKKRGFFGSISKRLFFSLSEDDAAFYRNQINTLKVENLQHILFANNQTTLFKETIKVLNNTMQTQIIQHSALQKQFEDLEQLLNNATVSSILNGKLNELMHYTTFIISNFWEKQRYFFDLITTKSMNFQLIPPKMFFSELQRISEMIELQGLFLPLPLTVENLPRFYLLTSTEGRIIDNSLVLRFSIPLVDKNNFKLYKAYSAPHRNEISETFSFITPHMEYIAHDYLNERFFILPLDEVRKCHGIDEKHLICKQRFPIMRAIDNSGCEINLLRNTNFTQTCDLKTVKLTEEIWTKLEKPNTYLYTLPSVQTVAIVCPNSRTKLQLQDTGIISLAKNCKIKTECVEIIAFQAIESKTSHHLTPSVKFNTSASDDITKSKHVKSLSNSKLPENLSDNDINKLTEIRDNIDELHKNNMISKASMIQSLNKLSENGIHPILLLIIAIIVIAIVIVAMIICFKYCAVPGCNILIFIILFVLIVPLVLFFL